MSRDIQIINYIYDEMSPAEKEAFIKEMNQDPSLAKEVEELVLAQAIMQVDKMTTPVETTTPVKESVSTDDNVVYLQHRLKRFKWLTGLAASIALGAMILAGSLLNQKSTNMPANLVTAEGPAADYITKSDLAQLVDQLNTASQKDMAALKTELNKSIIQTIQQKNQPHPSSALDEQKVTAMMASLKAENASQRKLFQEAIRQYSEANQKDFAALVQAINNQRGKDMQYINQSLNQISGYILDQAVTADNTSINAKYKVD